MGHTASNVSQVINMRKSRVLAFTFPVRDTSPVIAMFCLTGRPVAREMRAEMIVQPADGPSLGVAPLEEKERASEREREREREMEEIS